MSKIIDEQFKNEKQSTSIDLVREVTDLCRGLGLPSSIGNEDNSSYQDQNSNVWGTAIRSIRDLSPMPVSDLQIIDTDLLPDVYYERYFYYNFPNSQANNALLTLEYSPSSDGLTAIRAGVKDGSMYYFFELNMFLTDTEQPTRFVFHSYDFDQEKQVQDPDNWILIEYDETDGYSASAYDNSKYRQLDADELDIVLKQRVSIIKLALEELNRKN